MSNDYFTPDPALDVLFDDLDPEDREFAEYQYDRLNMGEPPPCPTCERFVPRWPITRLQQLFDRFHARYWPGQLADWYLEIKKLDPDSSLLGFCDTWARRIVVDLTRMRHSNRLVQGVLLHEMCHAAVAAEPPGHGLPFFQQVERLLECRVRVYVPWENYCDEPDVHQILTTLPRCAEKFRRCLRKREVPR